MEGWNIVSVIRLPQPSAALASIVLLLPVLQTRSPVIAGVVPAGFPSRQLESAIRAVA